MLLSWNWILSWNIYILKFLYHIYLEDSSETMDLEIVQNLIRFQNDDYGDGDSRVLSNFAREKKPCETPLDKKVDCFSLGSI